jgi:hypothetical protein
VNASQQPASYGDAEIRGRLRHWKAKLAQQYRVFDRTYRNPTALRPICEDFVKRSAAAGRRRAFAKLAAAFGAGATLEGLRLDGDSPLAVWSILKPREAVTVDADPESGLAQNCVTVNYVVAGVLPDRRGDRHYGLCEGLWTLEVPDHALGRCMARSGLMPDAIIAAAHHNILRLRRTVVIPDNRLDQDRRFLVKAGPGGFVCHLQSGPDLSLGMQPEVHARSDTWLAADQLHDDQILLVDDGQPGARLGDGWLVPAALRRIVRTGDRVDLLIWGELPELLAKPAGNA